MNNILIAKTFTFDAAHRLQNHDGKCRNLHGHTYSVRISLEGSPKVDGPQAGMVLDYGTLSAWWKSIEPSFDHRTILEVNDPLVDALGGGDRGREVDPPAWGWPILRDDPPTAENLALLILDSLKTWLSDYANIQGAVVRVSETPKTYAEAYWVEEEE